MIVLGFILAFFIEMSLHHFYETARSDVPSDNTQEDVENINDLIEEEIQCFPVALQSEEDYSRIAFEDSFMAPRTYGGNRSHMGTDIMDILDTPGTLPIVSMTDGVVENIGWLELGGYRIGIRSDGQNYYYYAHLCDYAEGLEEGTKVNAGQILGTMGDSGYGAEGTTGEFPVHLHLGIAVTISGTDYWINPYPFLWKMSGNFIEKKPLNP